MKTKKKMKSFSIGRLMIVFLINPKKMKVREVKIQDPFNELMSIWTTIPTSNYLNNIKIERTRVY